MTVIDNWKLILIWLSVAVLTVALKNYLVFLLYDTSLCPYLCPSVFGGRPFHLPFPLDQLFSFQLWVEERIQAGFDTFALDNFCLFTALVVAPLIEEGLYRGPLFLTRAYAGTWLWWTAAVLLCTLFALSHSQKGLALLPLFVLGMGAAWLIARTGRFWPSLALHALFNFYFASVKLCPFAFSGD